MAGLEYNTLFDIRYSCLPSGHVCYGMNKMQKILHYLGFKMYMFMSPETMETFMIIKVLNELIFGSLAVQTN